MYSFLNPQPLLDTNDEFEIAITVVNGSGLSLKSASRFTLPNKPKIVLNWSIVALTFKEGDLESKKVTFPFKDPLGNHNQKAVYKTN